MVGVAVDGAYAAVVAIGVVVVGAVRSRLRRDPDGDCGAAEDSFMMKVVKVCLVVMLVAGGIVWVLDRADDGPPDSGSGENAPQQPARHPDGGTKNR